MSAKVVVVPGGKLLARLNLAMTPRLQKRLD